MAAQLTQPQRAQLVRALRARQDGTEWIRSQDHGQRVTLASLYTRGLLTRRAWAKAGTTSPAHEYRMADDLYEAWLRKQQPQAVA